MNAITGSENHERNILMCAAMNGSGLILLYHRITDLLPDPQLLCVSPSRFAQQMALIRSNFAPMSVMDLLYKAQQQALPENAVAVTFDDGYEDNFASALPILEELGIPATFFIAPGPASRGEEFFWDELERIFLSPGQLPGQLNFRLAGKTYSCDLSDSRQYTADDARTNLHWNVQNPQNPTSRHKAYRELCGLMQNATLIQRQEAISFLRLWANIPPGVRDTHRAMNNDQIRQLANHRQMEVAAHTVDHPTLAIENPTDQKRQIVHSRQQLQQITGKPILGFSYSFGTRKDFTAVTVDAVKGADFAYALANVPGHVLAGVNRYQAPRFVVRNWSGEELIRQMQSTRKAA
jgi:peptidoglycan/xylan/chitin deacetylase (PgdA/CDA1 family)